MRDRSTLLAAVIALVVAATLVVADDLAPEPPAVPAPTPITTSGGPAAGSWVCGVGDPGEDGELTTVAARPGRTGDAPAQLELHRFVEEDVEVETLPAAFPGSDVRTTLDEELDGPAATWLRWRDGPVAPWREWHIDGDDDLPDVTVAGGCAAPSSSTWVVPGMSTEGGDEARLRLSNPFGSAATVAVSFLTPEGVEDPLILQNVTVPARSVRDVLVNETLPEQPDLAAVVEVASGRLSVEGVQFAREDIGDIDGGSLLAAAPASAEEWTIPWVADDDEGGSWLWVANAGDDTAPVELTLHTTEGGAVPTGLAEVSVPPGELRRIDLSGTFPEDVEVSAVAARSNGVPIVVSAGTRVTADDPVDTGFAVQLGASGTDDVWVVAGGSSEDREEELHLVNPTGDAAVVDVTLFDGAGSTAPRDLQDLELPAGSSRIVDLTEELDGTDAWTAFVTAEEGELVVGRVGRNVEEDEPLRLVAVTGVASSAWMPEASGLAAEAAEGLVARLRTLGGLGTDAEDLVPTDRPVPDGPAADPDTDPEAPGDEPPEPDDPLLPDDDVDPDDDDPVDGPDEGDDEPADEDEADEDGDADAGDDEGDAGDDDGDDADADADDADADES